MEVKHECGDHEGGTHVCIRSVILSILIHSHVLSHHSPPNKPPTHTGTRVIFSKLSTLRSPYLLSITVATYFEALDGTKCCVASAVCIFLVIHSWRCGDPVSKLVTQFEPVMNIAFIFGMTSTKWSVSNVATLWIINHICKWSNIQIDKTFPKNSRVFSDVCYRIN